MPSLSARISALLGFLGDILESVGASVVWFLSKLRIPFKKLVERIIQKHHTEDKGTGPPKEAPIIPNGVPSPPPNEKAKKTVYVHTPWWKTLLEVLAVGAGCWYGWVAWHQWKTQLDALDITREQIHKGQRAYLVLQHPALDAPPSLEGPLKIHVTLFNSGETPATEISYYSQIGIATAQEQLPPAHGAILFPPLGAKQDLTIHSGISPKLTEEQFRQITTEEVEFHGDQLVITNAPRLFWIVEVHYKDVFGGDGSIRMCSAYSQKIMATCTKGSGAMK